jgi:ParB-like chromosome segregation protein Spo0J
LEEAWIVQSLVSDHQMLQKEVADLLGRHKSWVCRRLQLAQRLEGGVVEDMRLGLISATIARELVRLPRGNQAPVAAAVHRHGLTCRQTAELVARMQGAPDEVREDLLDDPLRFLTSPPATALRRTDARLSEAGDKIRRSLDALARQARMTNGVVHSPSTGVFVCSDIDLLRPQMRDVAETLHVILATLTQLIEGGDDDA